MVLKQGDWTKTKLPTLEDAGTILSSGITLQNTIL